MSSAHLLLALFTYSNRAQILLVERNLDEEVILEHLRVLEEEPPRMVQRLRERAREIAQGSGSEEVDCLHLLISITRHRDSFAYRLIERTGTSITSLRNIAVSYICGNMPRRFRNVHATIDIPEAAPSRLLAPQVEEPPMPELEPMPPDEFEPVQEAVKTAVAKPKRARSPRTRTTTETRLRVEDIAPTLASCGVDLTEQARRGDLDMVIGREQELESLVDILGKRRANNPVLVGAPGVGKTAIVEGLAVLIAKKHGDVKPFHDKIVFALDTGALVAGTSLRGAFSERLGAIKNEVSQADGQIIVFIDELHTLIGAGNSGEGAQDAANELKAALARGEFPSVGATTPEEFRKYIEKDSALERRFTPIVVEEPSVDEAILILEGAIQGYSDHHGLPYSMDAVHAAVRLGHRFITERKLPDKAFAVIDLAGSRARRRGKRRVERMDVAKVIHDWTGVPIERLAEADADRFARAEEILGEKIVGHDHVVRAVSTAIRRGFAGFSGNRPIGSFLFLGPTGVGKTELVKVMAEFLFGRRDAIVRLDMSEMAEKHSVSRLIGAQPGYVGYEEGGQLTEALRRRPFQIVLFDEIEKAHKDVLNLLLQILDEGHLTDSRGRKVSFAHTLIVLTSNLGSEHFSKSTASIGFSSDGVAAMHGKFDAVKESARGQLLPELWGRLDEQLVFAPLEAEQISNIANLQLQESARVLFSEREITLEWDDKVAKFLEDNGGFSPKTGARGMRHAIQRYIEGPVSEQIIAQALSEGDIARAEVGEGEIVISKGRRRRKRRRAS